MSPRRYGALFSLFRIFSRKSSNSIGILGGTFDPVHFGHLNIAKHVLEKTNLSEIRFVPCYQPVHREPAKASAEHRLAMLKLAISDYPKFCIDEREINRKGESFMIDTLKSLRADFPNTSFSLILGFDAFSKLNTWKSWEQLENYANFIVINRQDENKKLTPELEQFLKQTLINNPKELNKNPNGKTYLLKITPIDISSTEIRNKIIVREDLKKLVPKKIIEYIKKYKLYSS